MEKRKEQIFYILIILIQLILFFLQNYKIKTDFNFKIICFMFFINALLFAILGKIVVVQIKKSQNMNREDYFYFMTSGMIAAISCIIVLLA